MADSKRQRLDMVEALGYSIDFLRELGRGGFGTVYRGYDEEVTRPEAAIKKVSKADKKAASTESVKYHFVKERILHENVIKVYDVKSWEDSMWIVMEFCDLGDLNSFFSKYHQKLDFEKQLSIMTQIAKGVVFLHFKNVVHRDIKPGNILLKNENGYAVVKLGDFGLSKFLDPDDMTSAMSSNVGTQWFKAPEFWDRKPGDRVIYHRNVDVYAAGLTFAAMLQAKTDSCLVPRVEGSIQRHEIKMPIGLAAFTRHQYKQSEIKVVAPDSGDSAQIRRLKMIIEEMTCFSPQARLSAAEVDRRLQAMHKKVRHTFNRSMRVVFRCI